MGKEYAFLGPVVEPSSARRPLINNRPKVKKGTFYVDTTCGQVVQASISTEGRLVIDLTTIGRTATEAEELAPKCQCFSAQGSLRRVDAKDRPQETQPLLA